MAPRQSQTAVFAIILSAFQVTGPAAAQPVDEIGALTQEIGPLFQQGKYDEATELADRSVKLAKKLYGDSSPRYAGALSWLAAIAQDRGRYDVAEAHYKRILEIDAAALGPESAAVGRDCNNLGLLYQEMGRYAEAEALYDRGLAVTREGARSRSLDGRDAPPQQGVPASAARPL